MLENKIIFTAGSLYADLKEDYPEPIKLNLPSWYKNLTKERNDFKGLKSCMPFLDTLTTGYVLKLPQDFILVKDKIIKVDDSEEEDYKYTKIFHGGDATLKHDFNLNSNAHPQSHPFKQIEGSYIPYLNKSDNVFKFLNPWHIKTPPGYSCLFLPPLNRENKYFSIIPGIVDTDSHDGMINFPVILKQVSNEPIDVTILKGTPYVQVMPFKREKWKAEIKKMSEQNIRSIILKHNLTFKHLYKKLFWSKKGGYWK